MIYHISMGRLFFILGLALFGFCSKAFSIDEDALYAKFWIYPKAVQMQWMDIDNSSSVVFYLEFDETKTKIKKFESEIRGVLNPKIDLLNQDSQFLLQSVIDLDLTHVHYIGLYGEHEVDPLFNKGKKHEDRVTPLFNPVRWSQMRYIIKDLENQKEVDLYLVKILLNGLLSDPSSRLITQVNEKTMCALFLIQK